MNRYLGLAVFSRQIGLLFILLLPTVIYFGSAWAQMDAMIYSPHDWATHITPSACWEEKSSPDTGVFATINVFHDLPGIGYPYHMALMVGVNDTLHAFIGFNNRTDKDYDLTGKDYEQWFVPVVYPLSADVGSLPFRDFAELGYRIRGWYSSTVRHPTPTKLPALANLYAIKMDIWNLPEGRFQLCVIPTKDLPTEIHALTNGQVYQYYPPQSLADSINGYEACFWRAYDDSNFVGAMAWVEKILAINPTSVPGWWLKASSAWSLGDTLATKKALDNALAYLNVGADPAMPDSTLRPLMQAEKSYIEQTKAMLQWHRSQLSP